MTPPVLNVLNTVYMFLGKHVRLEHWSTIAIPVAPRSRRGSTVTRLMGLRVRVPAEQWMSVCLSLVSFVCVAR